MHKLTEYSVKLTGHMHKLTIDPKNDMFVMHKTYM